MGILSGSTSFMSSTSMVPGVKTASDTAETGWITISSCPTSFFAISIMQASPTTMGRHCSYTSGRESALTVISGPMEAGSPIVMPRIGFIAFSSYSQQRPLAAFSSRTLRSAAIPSSGT